MGLEKDKESGFNVGDNVQYIENNHFYTVEKKNTEYFLTSPDHTSGFWTNEKNLRKIVADKANTQNDGSATTDIEDNSVGKFKVGEIAYSKSIGENVYIQKTYRGHGGWEYYINWILFSGWVGEDDLQKAVITPKPIFEVDTPSETIPAIDNGTALTSKHYNLRPIQPIEISQMVLTHEEFIGAMKFNIMKYTQRAGSKEGESSTKDWNKALQYKLWLELAEEGSIIDPKEDVL